MILAILGSLFVIGLVGIFGPWAYIHFSTRHLIHAVDSPDLRAEGRVALVLGARVNAGGRLSAMLEDRVITGVRLYEKGTVGKLIMSGDNSSRDYDEPTAMRRHAMGLGVPGRDVVRDFAGLRTFDSLVRARDIFGQTRIVIVSQEFHLPRALYLARSLGMDAVGVIADRRPYLRGSIRRSRMREIPACFAAMVDIWLPGRGAKYGGPMESLDGDAQTARYAEQMAP
jgi:SanA protein